MTEELSRRLEETYQQKEEITNLLAMVVELQQKVKKVSVSIRRSWTIKCWPFNTIIKMSWARFILSANANAITDFTSQGCFCSKCFAGVVHKSQLMQIIRCKFVTSKFVSHSHLQEVWTRLYGTNRKTKDPQKYSDIHTMNVCLNFFQTNFSFREEIGLRGLLSMALITIGFCAYDH